MKKIIHIIYFSIFILFPLQLFSHPHTFMDMGITAVTDENSILGFEIKWIFDFVFSIDTIRDCDWDEDGKFNKEEMEYLEYAAFNNLKNYHYFTWIKCNGKSFLPKSYKNFNATYKKEELTYYFFIPFQTKISELKDLEISIYDDTFFCDIAFFKDHPYSIRGAGTEKLESSLVKDKAIIINYDKTVISSQREGASYSGSFIPHKVVFKQKK